VEGQVSVSYTTSDSDNLAGNIYMVCAAPGFQIVGRAEETLAPVTATVNDATDLSVRTLWLGCIFKLFLR